MKKSTVIFPDHDSSDGSVSRWSLHQPRVNLGVVIAVATAGPQAVADHRTQIQNRKNPTGKKPPQSLPKASPLPPQSLPKASPKPVGREESRKSNQRKHETLKQQTTSGPFLLFLLSPILSFFLSFFLSLALRWIWLWVGEWVGGCPEEEAKGGGEKES